MGTQGVGRKRIPNREKLTAEDDALSQIAREAEARLAAKRAARAEAREIRMKELERQQKEMSDDEERMSVGSRGSFRPSDYSSFLGSSSRASSRASSARASPVVEERPDRDFLDKGSRTASTLSAATLASLGGASSRRGSCDTSFSVETEASIRDIKDSLAEAEEKYRKAMVSNAQLHNDKSTLMYQVEMLKEELSDMEELLWESQRHCEDTSKELARECQAHRVLQFQFKEMTETLKKTEELLTKHRVIMSPDVSTNGESGGGEDEDDVSIESGAQLAQELSHSGRESLLGENSFDLFTGTVPEQQSGDSKLPQDPIKYTKRWNSKHSLNIISTRDRTKADTVKPVKESDKKADQRQDRNKVASKLPVNCRSEIEPIKKFQIREDGKSLFRNGGVKEPASARLTVDDQAFKGRTEQCGMTSLIQINERETRQSVGQTDKTKCVDFVSPVHRVLKEKVFKSRLIPPRAARDIILEKKAVVSNIAATGKHKPSTEEKQKLEMGNETLFSDWDASAVHRALISKEKDGDTCRDRSYSEVEANVSALDTHENKINEFLTSVDSLKENEFVDKIAKIDDELYDGKKLKDEDTKVVIMKRTSQGLKQCQWTVSEERTRNDDKTLKNEHELSSPGEGLGFETKHYQAELQELLPAEEETHEKLQRIYGEEPVTESLEIPEKTQDNSFECLERNQVKNPKSLTPSPFVPIKVLNDCRNLKTTVQSMLIQCIENQGLTADIARFFSELPASSNHWISVFEETLNAADNMPRQHDTESPGQTWGFKLTTKAELSVKNFPEGCETLKDPESVEQSAAGLSSSTKSSSVSETLKAASPEVHHQTDKATVNSRSVCGDILDNQDFPENNQEAGKSTSEVELCRRKFKVEVAESSQEEKPWISFVDVEEEKESQSDPVVTSCSEEFVFVESHFVEHAETNMVDSGLDQVSASCSGNQGVKLLHRSQSCLVSVKESIELRLRGRLMLSTNFHVGRGSKITRLLKITANEIKAMAVPELVLISQGEGRIDEDRQTDEPAESSTENPKELSAVDVDSCEEADEWAMQQSATQQHHHPMMQDDIADVKVNPVRIKHVRREGFSLDCKIS